jgi:XTP/dITP diphosphohydrolase
MSASSQQLLIGTFNEGKVREIQHTLGELPILLRTLSEFPLLSPVEEIGTTYRENALLKAMGYARQSRIQTLADDSGLEVSALAGQPGVQSARFGGPGLPDEERVNLLLSTLQGVEDRRARFVCVIVISGPQYTRFFEASCEGSLGIAPLGQNGFGYDPIFIPDGYEQTFAELPPEVKNRISHRGKALEQVRKFLSVEARH